MTDQHMMQPVDHDPFEDDPPGSRAMVEKTTALEQRIFSLELTIAAGVQHILRILTQHGHEVAQLRNEHRALHQVVGAPKVVKYSPDGRPHRVEIDLTPPDASRMQ